MSGQEKDPKLMNDLQDYLEGDSRTALAAAWRIDMKEISGQRRYSPGVTVVIPTIPPRGHGQLQRALSSVLHQTRPVDAISIAVDHHHDGSAITRNRALAGVRTEWCAFLDDDDELMPDHLSALMDAARETGADVVYPWFDVPEGFDPFPQYEGAPFNAAVLRDVQNYIPVTVLARTGMVHAAGGFRDRNDSAASDASPCDEWGLWLKLLDLGAKFEHYNGRTWIYHWENNTSGRGDRW
jgi:glycosyltransferase involved in cell wall biosynthesis